MEEKKVRYLILTDINRGIEIDDIQSLIRLLVYSNEINLEGLIACTSCFLKKGAKERHEALIKEIIDAYEKVKPNLDVHASGYPTADYLKSITARGIDEFGKRPGKGFAHDKYNDNPGVNAIIKAADKDDDRPLFVGLWGGANTLAQAIYKVSKTRSKEELDKFLSKLRIYGISDQDHSAKWIRANFGDRLFYIVSPSKGSWFGNWTYYKATWPGISADNFKHGSPDGVQKGGFTGADASLVSPEWVDKNVISKSVLGALYPHTVFIKEGDTPTYLGLIPNGLNEPLRPDYGGWGGRYKFYKPTKEQFGTVEKFPIWTNSSDTVVGLDGKTHTSPQATIWRWRTHFQNDFAARMQWTTTNDKSKVNYAPTVKIYNSHIFATVGDKVALKAEVFDTQKGDITKNWYQYVEAGNSKIALNLNSDGDSAYFIAPAVSVKTDFHVILEATNDGAPPLTRYGRFIITVNV